MGFWKSKSLLPKVQMEKAMRTFIAACWQNSPLHRLEIQTPTTNFPAKALSEKLGFTLEGSKRDALLIDEEFVHLEIYGLLRGEGVTLWGSDWVREKYISIHNTRHITHDT